LRDYIASAFEDRQASPRDDLITHLAAVRDADGSKLSEAEAVSVIILLLFGGNTTTTHLIGNGILALLQHPDQLAALQFEPTLLTNAVEEILRFDPSITLAERVPTTDLDIDGCRIRPGEWLFLILTSANRDPAAHSDPDRFDIRRDPIHHLSFGGGRHLCLGSALARIETQIAIGSLITRFPDIRLAEPSVEPAYKYVPGFRGLAELSVVLQ
jgi:cytochrome P450